MIRAGLEDHFMGKLLGLPVGIDACYTNHMQADQNDLENLINMPIRFGQGTWRHRPPTPKAAKMAGTLLCTESLEFFLT
jgi:hypothetical protein